MFVYPRKYFTFYFFKLLALALLLSTLVQGFKTSSNMDMDLSNILNVNEHINTKSVPIPKKKYHVNYLAIEPVLFEKLHNIKLSQSVFRVTSFFQFDSMKAALSILLQYTHDFDENLKILYSKLLTNNVFDRKPHNERQHILSYSSLLKLSSDKLVDCKFQITQLTSQVDNIFATLNQSNPKCTKRGIIYSLFNFIFGNSNSAKEIRAIKNNMAILKENQDILSSQIQIIQLCKCSLCRNWHQ